MDKRKIGGGRVVTTFKMAVANPDPFKKFSDKFYGTLIFNARGGYFSFENEGAKKAAERIFRGDSVAMLATLELDMPQQETCVIRKIKIKLSRAPNSDEGLSFKFLQTSEEQLDVLNRLLDQLPPEESKAA